MISQQRGGRLLLSALLAPVLCLATALTSRAEPAGSGSWTGNGPRAKSVFAVAVDPVVPSTIYAGSMGDGVYKTTDGGATWDPSTAGLTNTFVRAVAISPADRSILFAGTNDGIFKSTDAGITWSLALATNHSIRSISFAPTQPSVLFAGSLGEGVYKSTDGGLTWALANAGITDLNVRSIAIHPYLSSVALAGSGTAGGVELTSNGGYYWNLSGDPDALGAVYDLHYDPLSASRILAGMFDQGVLESTDGGTSWLRINTGLTSYRCRALTVADSLRYVGTDSAGVYYRRYLDASWVQRNSGLTNTLVRALADQPGSPRTVYAGTDGEGVFKTTNAGVSWAPLNTYLTDTAGRCLLVAHDPGWTLLCGTGFGDGIWRSTDQAATWTRGASYGTRNSVLDLAESQADHTLYAAIYSNGVYRSVDGGLTWTPTDTLTLGNRFVRCVSVNPANGQEILAGTGNGTWRTLNGGASWSQWNAGFPPAASVRTLVRSPYDPQLVLAGTDSSGVYKTTNGGALWTAVNNGLPQPYIRCLAFQPGSPGTILLGCDRGVFRSTDQGANWAAYGAGLADTASVRSLLFFDSNPTRVWAAVWEGGVFASVNGGRNWAPMNGGLPDLKVYSLALDAGRFTLYAGTRLRGVFAYTYDPAGMADRPPEASATPLLRLRANPGAGRAEFETGALAGASRLDVYDAAGAHVRALFRDWGISTGRSVVWDGLDDRGRPVPRGVYWARLESGGGSTSVRVALVR